MLFIWTTRRLLVDSSSFLKFIQVNFLFFLFFLFCFAQRFDYKISKDLARGILEDSCGLMRDFWGFGRFDGKEVATRSTRTVASNQDSICQLMEQSTSLVFTLFENPAQGILLELGRIFTVPCRISKRITQLVLTILKDLLQCLHFKWVFDVLSESGQIELARNCCKSWNDPRSGGSCSGAGNLIAIKSWLVL